MVSQAAKFLLNIGSTLILARVLTPGDFGLIASVTPITGFILLFKDLGLGMATVQRAEINHQQVSSIFWINVLLSVILALACVSVSPLVSAFYQDQRAGSIILALSVTFIFGGLTAQHQALLERKMRFLAIAISDIFSLFVSVTVGIVFALLEFQYWALVLMMIAGAATNMIMVWVLTGWVPGRPTRADGIKEMLRYGGNLTGFNILNFIGRNIDNVLIRKMWGETELGFYSKAYSLLMLPIYQINAPISAIAVPAMCVLQGESERYKVYYRKALAVTLSVSFPLIACLYVGSYPIIMLILGQQWGESSIIFKYLCLASFAQSIYGTVGWIYRSNGRTDRMFRWSIFSLVCMLIAFAIGVQYQAKGVALAYAAVNILLTIPAMIYAIHGTSISLSDLWAAGRAPLMMAVIIVGISESIKYALPIYAESYYLLPVWGLIGAATWLMINRLVSDERNYLGAVSELRTIHERKDR